MGTSYHFSGCLHISTVVCRSSRTGKIYPSPPSLPSIFVPTIQIVHEVRSRRRYLWVPTTPSPPPLQPKPLSPSREPSFLSGHPPPPISSSHSSLDDHSSDPDHASSLGHHKQKKEPLPSYNGSCNFSFLDWAILGLDIQIVNGLSNPLIE